MSESILINAMSELIMEDPDYLEQGVPPDQLHETIMRKESFMFPKRFLERIIQKEVDNGRLTKMPNGNYCLSAGDGENDDSPDYSPMNQDCLSNTPPYSPSSSRTGRSKPSRKKSEMTSSQEEKKESTIRVGERRKRAKKVFDPSDNNIPNKKRKGKQSQVQQVIKGVTSATTNSKKNNVPSTSSKQSSQKYKSESADSSDEDRINNTIHIAPDIHDKITGGVCTVCRQHRNSNDGKLIECRDCSNKAHPTCLQGDGMLRLRPDNTWQCPHCKTCVVCIETTDAGILTVCSVCADAYHALCHSPPIPEKYKAWDQWECLNCVKTHNSGSNLDTTYIEKLPISDRSSKYSDQSLSDSRKSSQERKREKSSAKSIDSDDKNDKDDHSISPNSSNSIDKSEYSSTKYSRKLISPITQNPFEYKSDSNGKSSKPAKKQPKKPNRKQNNEQSPKTNSNSVFMNNHSYLKYCSGDVFKKHPKDRDEINIDPSIPNAEKWTFHDVYQYFVSFFPEHAHVFRDHEIDGRSLLLLRRHDVISNFDVPLGFALKIYRHVVKLQSRKDDFTMCWL